MKKQQGRTRVCSVVSVEIMGYADFSMAQEASVKARFGELINAVVGNMLEEDRLIVDTGNGAAICFLGDPEDALYATVKLRQRLLAEPATDSGPIHVRIGIHLGPVRVLKSLDGTPAPMGDGFNGARQVMGFAEPDQILVSRSFHETLSNLTLEYARRFRYLGLRNDERESEYPVYELMGSGSGADSAPGADPPPVDSPSTEMISYTTGWERAELTAAAVAVAPYVGRRARAVVKEAAEQASDVTHFYRLLAEAIPMAQGRKDFCRAQGIALDETVAGNGETAADDNFPPTMLLQPPAVLDPALLRTAEQRLALYLGPLARILVKKHAAGQPGIEQFLARLADELAGSQRQDFLDAMRKARGAS